MKIIICLLLLLLPTILFADTTSGLVGWWKLDEASGTSAFDNSSKGNTATLTNTSWINACPFNNCVDFNGTTSIASASASSSLDSPANTGSQGTDPITISAWVYLRSTGEGTNGMIANKDSGTCTNTGLSSWTFCIQSGALYFKKTGVGLNARKIEATGGTVLPLNQWIHVAATYSGLGVAGAAQVYLNGVNDSFGVAAFAWTGSNSDSGYSLNIGNDASSANTFDGYIDDVRLYKRVLSTQDIKMLFIGDNKIRNATLKNVSFRR